MTEKDDIHVLVGNLPPDTVEEDLQDAFESLGYDLGVTLVREGSTHKLTAIVRFEGMTRRTAETLADRINGMPWRDRILRAYVPLFMQ